MLKKIFKKIERHWIPYVIAYGAKIFLKILFSTCKINIHGLKNLIDAGSSSSPCMIMLWHDRILLLSEILKNKAPQFTYTAVISRSRDAEALAVFTQSYPMGRVIRVAHDSRHAALNKMIHHLKVKKEIILISPDGPRGPQYVAKPGIVVAAKAADAWIVPFSWNASKTWELNTWDKMKVPKPFSTIEVRFGSPIFLNKENGLSLEEECRRLEKTIKPSQMGSHFP